MANRGKTLNSEIFCLNDLKEKGSKKLPKAYRGGWHDLQYPGTATNQQPCS